jgi:quercetin dioxygenase-like cupin family protein
MTALTPDVEHVDEAARTVDSAELDALRIEQVGGHRIRVLWRDDAGSAAGVLDLVAYERLPHHAHHDAEHHVWVERGSCQVSGRCLAPGSYIKVDPGSPHSLEAGPRGCRPFFVYRRLPVGGRAEAVSP